MPCYLEVFVLDNDGPQYYTLSLIGGRRPVPKHRAPWNVMPQRFFPTDIVPHDIVPPFPLRWQLPAILFILASFPTHIFFLAGGCLLWR